MSKKLFTNELRKVVSILVEKYRPIAIVLFGSRARGDYKPWSDYDILIIADFDRPYLERIGDILEVLSDIELPIEPHPYTLEEALKMLSKGNPVIVDALSEGMVLYKSPDFEKLVNKFNEMLKKGLKRTNTSIIVPIT
ncbi:nucleotidyltransferase domain-containing protein [Ignisphaera sp. 4213-co]|uniref:Nucleotidyltransferase domain-containing protein n=1 Tax=Ignisphaera cupida TaxID=3050454 RepID=A0ABD4Z4S2_9CREN|nr:nucleotidyltransferase domain-containing protein [Ignisphaera sp. 4213-co]MDK6028312.1 nucleotidyltransferase domain-containing protein [Ignisphaera sp. 4213-co]